MPEITVIITAYNLEKYIENCLRELEHQTFQKFEVLIVDDCSKDHTTEIIQKYQAEHTLPIQLISTGINRGLPGRTRNFALNSGLIRGTYLVFLDGDDNIEPDFLEQLYAGAVESGADITLCAYDRFEDETGHVLCQEMKDFPGIIQFPPQDDILAFINGSLWNKLIRTSCIGDCRIPDFKVGEDLSFQLELYDRCSKIACIDKILIHYRVRGGSIISNTGEDTIYLFAEKLLYLWQTTDKVWMKQTLELVAFIHIGLSMTMRAYDNPNIRLNSIIEWVDRYMSENYDWFRGNPYFKLRSLKSHGIKGIGLWAAKMCYQIHCYSAFLWIFKKATRMFHIDIKF